MRKAKITAVIPFFTLIALSACNVVPQTACGTIPVTGVDEKAGSLSATVLGTPLQVSGPEVSTTAVQPALQQLLILNQTISFDCHLIDKTTPGNDRNQLILTTEQHVNNLSLYAIQLAQATNNQQIEAATASSSNSLLATKVQAAASPSASAASGAPIPGNTAVISTPQQPAPAAGQTQASPVVVKSTGSASSNVISPATLAASSVLAGTLTAQLHPNAPTAIPALPVNAPSPPSAAAPSSPPVTITITAPDCDTLTTALGYPIRFPKRPARLGNDGVTASCASVAASTIATCRSTGPSRSYTHKRIPFLDGL